VTAALPETIAQAAVAVLNARDPAEKASLSRRYAQAWRRGELAFLFDVMPPETPGRPERPELLLPNKMPKRGKAGSEANRIALLHALAHIEFNAIDLAWDAAARFGAGLPRAFTDDWVQVGDDEARHFGLLSDRLLALGSHYGALPAHSGLWDAAAATKDDLSGRLAVVPMVLEARGLDVTPETIARLLAAGDSDSAAILEIIYHDEITHVAVGVRWFRYACDSARFAAVDRFHASVRRYFRGALKPPFNDSARFLAGLLQDFYLPLAAAPPKTVSPRSPEGGR
jgi:uncharacterized ferritin-like protein (DUF455 family)